jgi:Fe-Mn family superoxide dismutase
MFTLPGLPYAYDALSPVMSEKTLHFHHDKHHAAYVKTLNSLVEASGDSHASLEALIVAEAKSTHRKLFNNAAQAWNHAFFWVAMSPDPSKSCAAPLSPLGWTISAPAGSGSSPIAPGN